MTPHEITLNYVPGPNPNDEPEFLPDPNPIAPKRGDTIRFKLGIGPSGGKIRVTFAAPGRFSAGTFHHDDPPVRVEQSITSPTTYHCELLVDGVVKASSKEGGDIVPPTEI